ncbi:hypothetical protein [Pseudoduganella buxea]|uniref:Uncharacterized protein n=1 Tax=Pseudoduganella buxea TaxID=1949069 RepID=A0A6I3T2P0_9BURK|nr:hypothetical protein [Pseudoduganella buxea]MTV55664.1 hypothetical protein [Pseudoduganella buxea]GGB93708.1 hypothetical protein GCM10011572_14590 [Pseudoduganella buxea]
MLAALLLPPAPAASDEFCQSWTSVYETAHRGFRKWRGAYESTLEQHTANIFFPNAKSCDVEEDEFEFQFHCGWQYAESEVERARADALALSNAIRQCLKTKRQRARSAGDIDDDGRGKGRTLWRDFIQDNHDTALGTVVSAYEHPEKRLRSGRTFPASIRLTVRIRYAREGD